jgi:ATP-dependent Lhr-like helicase
MSAIDQFSAPTRTWFAATFSAPTAVQERGWTAVTGGGHTLMCAPTGSGKTLAAFLWSIDRLLQEPVPAAPQRCRVLYVSPLKALTVDVERNLRAPLRGIALAAEREGVSVPELRVAVRTGDTPAADRRTMERHPPDLLITTPESLFLLLTSRARSILESVRWVIVDEIHSIAATKRGSHFALSLERLCALTRTEPQRIGLSATQRPLEETGRFLGGADRDVTLVETGGGFDGAAKLFDIRVEVPVEDLGDIERDADSRDLPEGAPRRSIWPALHPRLLELINEHRSTIVFANSRRLSERLTAQLNELAGTELVRAHHGSIARERRVEVEDGLKSGRLPAIVATSSLELGIDMGAVDLVIQVEAPPSVASGIQRIGRAGHHVGEPSTGVVFPKFRGDLLECAVVVDRMLTGDIETTRVQRSPLDVLAQQIVAMTAMDEWGVDELAALVRRAYPYAALGDRSLTSVLEMLSGAYPSDEFAELRPRLVWDRAAGTLRGRRGSQRLAVTSGGTIPDRGLYGVRLLDDAVPGARGGGRRVGELDEEMVYELRPGDTFVLGATTWRALEITASEVLVAPAPGEPGRMSFWHGDALGRPVEVGRALGQLLAEVDVLPDAAAERRLRERSRLDPGAARNLIAYVREQRAATGALPDDRTVVVERFRDQLGDWRLCVLTPWGARVHAPWSLAVAARLQEQVGMDVQRIHTDDGFAVRLPDVAEPPDPSVVLLEPEEIDELVTQQLSASALFASRFRENAARALLLPRRRPGERTPLWLQRQRSHNLLQVAGKHPGFPILAETYRECLTDVFDMNALRDLLTGLRSRTVRLAVADTERASPFASSLVFDYIAEYMYEADQPLAERRASALTLDRELLADLLGSAELRELLDPAVLSQQELEMQGLLSERWPREVDEAHDLLRRLGDLSPEEAAARGLRPEWLAELEADRRALRVRVASEARWIAVEDAALYRDALGVSLPLGVPEPFLESTDAPLQSLLRRYSRTHVPFTAADPAARWGVPEVRIESSLARLVTAGDLLVGEFRPGGAGREWCHPDVLRSLRRRSLAVLRHEIEPVPVEALGRFLPAWQGIGSRGRGLDRLVEVVGQLQGVALPVSALEREILAPRVDGYSAGLLDELASVGEVVWVGRGALGGGDGRVAFYLRADASRLIPDPPGTVDGELHARLRAELARRGASFFGDLLRATESSDVETTVEALWDLVWAGEVTNDTVAPLRHVGPSRFRPTRRPLMRLAPPRAQGRWSLVADLLERRPAPTERLHALCTVLLQRYGVLTRETAVAEGVPGGFASLYPVLRAMEESGRVRRGYFVDGLGGSQFALPGAVDRLRGLREGGAGIVALAAVDPANAHGVTVAWPQRDDRGGRLARAAGAFVVLDNGELRLYLERGRHSLLTFGEVLPEHASALGASAARGGKLEIHTADGVAVEESLAAPALRAAGFVVSTRGLVLYSERRQLLRA